MLRRAAMKLRIQYASDLHLEFTDKVAFEPILRPAAPVLALAGDIGRPDRRAYDDFIQYCSRNWHAVFVVAGNHEFYNTYPADRWVHKPSTSIHTVAERLAMCEDSAARFPNVHFLNRRRVDHAGIAFLGATLWTDTRGIEDLAASRMNDYKLICAERRYEEGERVLTVADTQAWHDRDREWLDAEIAACEEAGQPAVVLTHHLPTLDLISPKYQRYGDLNRCYASDCADLIRSPVRAWIAGHSHAAVTIHRRGVACTLNPRGYPGELGTGYCPEIFVDVSVESGGGADERYPEMVASMSAETASAPSPRTRAESSQSLDWV